MRSPRVGSVSSLLGLGVLALSGCLVGEEIPIQPIADAGFDRWGEAPGSIVVFDGSLSHDPDGAELTYTWTLSEQPDESDLDLLDGADPAHPVLIPVEAGAYLVTLVVSNGARDSRPDVVGLWVDADVDPPPVAAAECEEDECDVLHGEPVQLIGNASEDPEGQTLTYLWRQLTADDVADCADLCPTLTTGNPCDQDALSILEPDKKQTSAVLPDLPDVDFIFEIEVDDGLSTDAACLVYTTYNTPPTLYPTYTKATLLPDPDDNDLPIADTDEGDTFYLGSVPGDPDGDTFTVSWEQVSPVAPLATFPSGQSSDNISALVPLGAISADTPFVFRVTISDGFDEVSEDVNLTVHDVP
jgi:hypothetical protein